MSPSRLGTPQPPGDEPRTVRLVNPDARYQQAPRLIEPSTAGYLYVAVQTTAAQRPGPVVSGRKRRARAIATLEHYATAARRSGDVTEVSAFRAVALAPMPATMQAAVPHPDAAMLIQAATPDAAHAIAYSSSLKGLIEALARAGCRTHVLAARNVRRIADVEHRPGPLFLFNHFWGADQQLAVALWERLAAWYQRETGLRNSVLLAPPDSDARTFALVNHASFDLSLPALVWRQFARRTFRTYVKANLAANDVTASPGLYRLVTPNP